MSIELQLLILWVLFGGTHILGSTVPIRERLIASLGLVGFKVLYSLVSLATFVPLVWVFWGNRHEGEVLFDPSPANPHITETLMLFSFVFLARAHATPNPATSLAELSGRFASHPRGIHRITRQPLNTGFGLFGLAHMISNPTVGDWVFWGGWVVYAVLSAIHQDRRLLATGPPEFKSFYAETSFVPFAAVLQGRQKIAFREISWGAVGLAIAAMVLVRWLHPMLIGGFQ